MNLPAAPKGRTVVVGRDQGWIHLPEVRQTRIATDTMGLKLLMRRKIESALKLPHSDSDELIANVKQLEERGSFL